MTLKITRVFLVTLWGHSVTQNLLPTMILRIFWCCRDFILKNENDMCLVLGSRKINKSELSLSFSPLLAVLLSLLTTIDSVSSGSVFSWHFSLVPFCIFTSLKCYFYLMKIPCAQETVQYSLYILLSLSIAILHSWKIVTWLNAQSWCGMESGTYTDIMQW